MISTIEQFNSDQRYAFSSFAIPYIMVKYYFRRMNINTN
ncbi:MAG: hypothetical protein ACP8RL_08210 [cyanobacterium endosymbiont of Rhopalodia inflata]